MKRKRLFGAILCVFFLLTLSACGQGNTTSWQEQYDLGVRYLEEGNYEEAIIAFNAAIEIDPKNEETYFQLAQIYMTQEDYSAAEEILNQGIERTDSSRLRTLQEEIQRSNELISLLGKTMGDVVERYGNDYTATTFEGSTCLVYEDLATFYLNGGVTYPDNNAVIEMISAYSSSIPLIGDLNGAMTYPELLNAVGEETSVEPPEYSYSEQYEDGSYSTDVEYQGHTILYTWVDDPETHASASATTLQETNRLEPPTYEPDIEMIKERFERVGRNYFAEVLSIPDEAGIEFANIQCQRELWWEMDCYTPTDNGLWLYASFQFNPWTDEATITPEWGGDFGAEFKISEYDY